MEKKKSTLSLKQLFKFAGRNPTGKEKFGAHREEKRRQKEDRSKTQ